MKFGAMLPRNQVPEWVAQYINYKALKKLIKIAAQDSKDSADPDLAVFFHSLDRNLEDVDYFYNKKYQDFSRRLKLLEDRYGSTKEAALAMAIEDREDLLAALLELRGHLRNLQWYGEVNRRGFIKITKKLDKKIPSANAQKKYLALKVDPAAFATNSLLFESLNKLNDWISTLSEATTIYSQDDNISSSSLPLRNAVSGKSVQIPPEVITVLEQQIRHDSSVDLAVTLEETKKAMPEMTENVYQQFMKSLLQRAIFARSRQCVQKLLTQIVFLDDQDDLNRRNCIHRLVVSIGRSHATADSKQHSDLVSDPDTEPYSFITPAAHPSTSFRPNVALEEQHQTYLNLQHESILFLKFLLANLQPSQRSALMSKDITGRTPLHFAAQYGVCVMCEVIIDHLRRWNLFNIDQGIDGPAWQDNDGWAPLHLSVIAGHPLTTRALLASENTTGQTHSIPLTQRPSTKSAAVLALATKANSVDIVRTLVEAGVNVNYQDSQGETALHVAARFGHEVCAKILLDGNALQKASTELMEVTYGWTPLFVACVDGHLSIVELLVDAGADLGKCDYSGWTATEHAALRGHIDITRLLTEVTPLPEAESDVSTTASTSPPSDSLLSTQTSNESVPPVPPVKISETVKSFGHRYLTNKSMVLVSLGSMDTRKSVRAVDLDRIPLANAHSTQLDTALSIVISAKSAEGEAEVIDLPVQDNISTEPIVFHAADPTKVQLLFDLVPTYAGTHDRIVGRGVAMLSNVKTSLGSKKMPLQGDVTVPIVAAGNLEVIGSVTFNFLVITPFHHPKMSITKDQTYWKRVASTMVIGHRGLGKNIAGRNSLQLGENTIQSFIAAANLGASYVEFDVQLTKDHVPVIYHDFLVSETGIDAPVHTLTLEQFLHVGDTRTPLHSRAASPAPFDRSWAGNNSGPFQPRQRSKSVGGADNDSLIMDERMKHTRDFKKKGFKGNSRGNHIQAPFATLEEMFKKLPSHVGFNIEMKYPMLSESEDEEMDQYAVELNSFVDTVLTKVYDLGEGRNIIFSSFNPDICLLLSFKQPSIPVLFLTDAGTSPVGDIRATSLQEAVRFASRWNLLGIVASSEPFVMAPRLVRVVKESGLVCVSYGTLNNDNSKVRLQVEQGIDAVIVDNVLAIRKGLTEGAINGTKDHSTATHNGSLKPMSNMKLNSSTKSLNVPI